MYVHVTQLGRGTEKCR